jgi:hypothetical protein
LYTSYFSYIDFSNNYFEDIYLKGQSGSNSYAYNPYFVDADSGTYMLMYSYYFSTSSIGSILTDSYLAISKVKMSSLTMKNVGTYKCANFFFAFATNDIDLSDL